MLHPSLARTDLEMKVSEAEHRLVKQHSDSVCIAIPSSDWYNLPSQAHSATDAPKELELNLWRFSTREGMYVVMCCTYILCFFVPHLSNGWDWKWEVVCMEWVCGA